MQNVFSSLQTNNLELKNRLVRSATNDNLGGKNGEITKAELALYRELAQNEVGLIISAHIYCEKLGKASEYQNGLDSDCNIKIMQEIAKTVHENGSRMIMQISHAGAKAISESPICPDNMQPEDFERVKSAFVSASLRAKAANMDGVQIHCAHGYLLSQFIDPATNHRTDCYGGNAENRFMFAKEIIQAVMSACGDKFSVSIKINSNVPENDDAYEADLLQILTICNSINLDFAELSGYNTAKFPNGSQPYYLNRAIKMRQNCALPLALCGGIKSSAHAQALIDGGIDMVSVCRALINTPNFAGFLHNNTPIPCISCRKCFTEILTEGRSCVLHEKNSDIEKYSSQF